MSVTELQDLSPLDRVARKEFPFGSLRKPLLLCCLTLGEWSSLELHGASEVAHTKRLNSSIEMCNEVSSSAQS